MKINAPKAFISPKEGKEIVIPEVRVCYRNDLKLLIPPVPPNSSYALHNSLSVAIFFYFFFFPFLFVKAFWTFAC